MKIGGIKRAKAIEVSITTLAVLIFTVSQASAQTWHQIGDTRPNADTAWISLKERTIKINIKHKSGIGKIEFVQHEGKWPRFLRLVFHNFKALEKFKIWTQAKSFETSISAFNKKTSIDLGQEFTATRKEDSIIIECPKQFIRKVEPSIHVEWIDFYRH